MLQVIDKGRGRNMAAGTTEARLQRKRLCEQGFAAPRRIAALRRQSSAKPESRVGQEIDVLNVDDQGIEDGSRRLRTGEFVYDDIANKIAQRGHPSVMPIRSKEASAAQARNRDRIQQ